MTITTLSSSTINLEKKNDEIASVCKVDTEPETTDEESVRDAFNENMTEVSEPSENIDNEETPESTENSQE